MIVFEVRTGVCLSKPVSAFYTGTRCTRLSVTATRYPHVKVQIKGVRGFKGVFRVFKGPTISTPVSVPR